MSIGSIQMAFINFWSQFGLPAYLENNVVSYDIYGNKLVPDLPYITFSFSRDDFCEDNLIVGKVWTRSDSYTSLLSYLEEIEKAIPNEGTLLTLENDKGAIWLTRGKPFIQHMPIDEEDLKVGYINIEARSFVI